VINGRKTVMVVAAVTVIGTVGTACANSQQRGTLIGAGAGAAAGALAGDGNVWAILAGAAIGGTAGNLIGKHMDEQARELEQAVPTASVDRVDEGINVTFDSSLMFEINSADLNPAYQDDLAAAAAVFAKYEDTHILVEGHTDNTGSDAINEPLSEQRAKAVSAFFVSQGISPDRLSEKWYGSTQPRYPNDTPENQAKNRRVELAIVANEDMVAEAQAGTLGSGL
jgi:outer membrane protein OmpA-like peptidoglycan-associated protein